ncbi:MAG: tRNA epoxyqueuosine(34) reductase QueG [Planctomycetes bacterium]|nr:tRNA epoxyqueuosine(34) reductase QueG [Planctomycetota bacterium]
MATSTLLSAFIRETARELGFDEVGFAPATPPVRAEFLCEWLAAGYHAGMAWMARDPGRRIDPRVHFAGAVSVVSLAVNYHSPEPTATDSATGRISRYARGDDYHEVLKGRLEELARRVRERFPDVPARIAVDTSAILEKPLAQAAGVGWIGKNACLLVEGKGSWFFLGEILVGAELPRDAPALDRCGSCRRCLDACPTGAFAAPYVLDSNRCLSYLTIEHRGPVARELRPLFGNRVFGCDDCQDVCPWNRFARPAAIAQFRPRPENIAPLLSDLLGLDDDAFRRRFRGSPVLRAKRDGFLRNVAIAAGNSGDRRLVAPLSRALGDTSALVRGHAAWALGRLGGAQAGEALEIRLALEEDPWVHEEIELALLAESRAG